MVLNEDIWSHFGMWWAVLIWIVIYGVFLLFVPFYKKSHIKPAGVYAAFVLAFAVEMFGVPFSMYALGWLFGIWLPEGVLWGHTLGQYIGLWGMYLGIVVSLLGIALVLVGWRKIHQEYWRMEAEEGKLVQTGIYRHIRHPQYIGFFLITFGMMLEWVTIPLLILYVLLLVLYYRLAKREEADMVKEFGEEYIEYKKRTKMFIPHLI